jgi:hypothetical protein
MKFNYNTARISEDDCNVLLDKLTKCHRSELVRFSTFNVWKVRQLIEETITLPYAVSYSFGWETFGVHPRYGWIVFNEYPHGIKVESVSYFQVPRLKRVGPVQNNWMALLPHHIGIGVVVACLFAVIFILATA